jgi:hypothetical protein
MFPLISDILWLLIFILSIQKQTANVSNIVFRSTEFDKKGKKVSETRRMFCSKKKTFRSLSFQRIANPLALDIRIYNPKTTKERGLHIRPNKRSCRR